MDTDTLGLMAASVWSYLTDEVTPNYPYRSNNRALIHEFHNLTLVKMQLLSGFLSGTVGHAPTALFLKTQFFRWFLV